MIESALIVSRTDKSAAIFKDVLNSASINQIIFMQTCGEARRILLEREFDLVVINAPLQDESGENLSRYIASKNIAQVILVVKNEFFDAVSAVCEADGVLTIAKPVSKTILWSAISLVKSVHNRINKIQNENEKLKQRIDDIRVTDRAKLILITYMSMSEKEAHRYIEKQAMDLRTTKRAIAEGILKTYEN
ncbi:MAG: ANTAR domain-containing protein [Lachnospiraceae bacterium]|nr:ANTAR domain-containing protein [Lachnospiraceae bacterium]